ncbi:MAG: 6-phosphogluconolactonase [Parvibaculales bacterium]
MSSPCWFEFEEMGAAVSALAEKIRAALVGDIAERGGALLCVPGGSTPKPLFEVLSGMELEWGSVSVLANDERYVGHDDPASNYRLIKNTLCREKAASAKLVSLYSAEHGTAREAEAEINRVVLGLGFPASFMVLGMGEDGHFASLFPKASALGRCLSERGVVAVPDGSPDMERISLSLPLILDSKNLALFVRGGAKKVLLEEVIANPKGSSLPIARLIEKAENRLAIFHAA